MKEELNFDLPVSDRSDVVNNEDIELTEEEVSGLERSKAYQNANLRGVLRGLEARYGSFPKVDGDVLQKVAEDYGVSTDVLEKMARTNFASSPLGGSWRANFLMSRQMRNGGVVDLHRIASASHIPLSQVAEMYKAAGGDESKIGTIGPEGGDPLPESSDLSVVWKSDEIAEKKRVDNARREYLRSSENVEKVVKEAIEKIQKYFEDHVVEGNIDEIEIIVKEGCLYKGSFYKFSEIPYPDNGKAERAIKASIDMYSIMEYVIKRTNVDDFIDAELAENAAFEICAGLTNLTGNKQAHYTKQDVRVFFEVNYEQEGFDKLLEYRGF